MSIIDALITDRTQADVDRAKYFVSLWITLPDGSIQWTGTTDELSEYWAGLKGMYTYIDLNRVGAAILYLAGRLTELDYPVTVGPKTDWTEDDDPNEVNMTNYLQQVSAIRAVLPAFPHTPAVPADMAYLTYQEANAIEQILVDVETLIQNMIAAFRHCGAAVCGGDGLLIL